MAVPIKKQCDGYSYVVPFCGIDNESIAESREVFASYKSRGVIILGDYDDPKWTMTDEVRKQVPIDFTFSEVHNCLNDLEVSHQMAQKALRVFATSMFGFSLLKIRADVDAAKRFLSNKTIPDDAGQAFAILRILDLLPTDTAFSEEMTDALPATMDSSDPGHRQQRSLGFLETYLRFDDLMKDFWSTASKQDKLLYFPVWFWWTVTCVIPLRPRETSLTPRSCVLKRNGKYYLLLRRTKQKGAYQAFNYSISKDYDICEYQIPDNIAKEILWYVAETDADYESDIDVLFSKKVQFAGTGANKPCDNHYTYANLKAILQLFFKNVAGQRYRIVSSVDQLADNEIQPVQLGDTRHIAMISLIMQGGNPTVCRELAGHSSVNMSDHYYTNIKNFINVLGEYRIRPQLRNSNFEVMKDAILSTVVLTPVKGGSCLSEKVRVHDYSPCEQAVDEYGRVGICRACKYYVSQNGQQHAEEAEERFHNTWTLVRHAMNAIRAGQGIEENLSSLLDRLNAEARHYYEASAVERLLKTERGMVNG